MPSLGADMEAGTLVKWNVKPGDEVRRGDIIAEVATDKGDIEVEVFEDGTVTELLVTEGAEVPVGTVLALIGQGAFPAAPSRPIATPAATRAPGRVKASPLARRLAAERGVDLHSVRGTGVDSAITRDDIERATAPPKEPSPTTLSPTKRSTPRAPKKTERVRAAIASAMARANREIPHYYLETQIDMTRALAWLAKENESLPIDQRLLHVVLLLRAVASSLEETPELNGYWVDDTLEVSAGVHIGLAVALRGGGLVTPALHDVQQKSVYEAMAALSDLVSRARTGRLKSSELTDATITVTNLGDLGVETVHGVIYPPQVALVGFGKITEKPWAEGGMLGVRAVLSATLAGDHRATDGRRGAQFLDALNRHLQKPEEL